MSGHAGDSGHARVTPRLAFTLPPNQVDLERLAPLYPLVDLFEVCPETTWWCDGDGALRPNGYHPRFAAIAREHGKNCIAHGVAFSLGSARPDPARRARWLERIAADQETFHYEWYSDHFGVTEVAGENLSLPLPIPRTEEAAAAVRASLAALQRVVPDVGFENSVFYVHAGDPAAEPAFLARCLNAPRTHLVLDLHNLHTTAVNRGIDPRAWLAALPLDRVIELHVSGGSWSDPAWLASGRVLRLDSHDAAVPEEVWQLAAEVVPRCSKLRALTLERMENTIADDDVARLRDELARARALLLAANGAAR